VRLKKIFLIVLLVSLAAAAAIGVAGILSPWRQSGPLLATMLSVGLFSLTLLGTAIAIDRRKWRVAMRVSVVISTIGVVFFLTMIWFDEAIGYPLSRTLGRLMVNVGATAVALPLGALLALTRFSHPGLNVVRVLAIALVFVTGGVMCAMIWVDPDSDAFKLLGVLTIFTVLGVIGLPVLHKLAGMPLPSETVAPNVNIALTCPRCGTQQTLPAGQSRCARCRLKISIEVEEPRCPKCSYLLYHLTEPRCPECGQPIGADEVVPVAAAAEPAADPAAAPAASQ
jgi:hypothetical protein